MPNKLGQIQKGERLSRSTEFQKGEHWREKQPFWEKEWLNEEYTNKKRSAPEIAADFGLTGPAILFWLKKHGIPRRNTSETRKIKKWGISGKANGMYGRTGKLSPRWLGGVTPERQALYCSREWAKAVRVVWKRDHGICQRCKQRATPNNVMHIHHIVSFAVKELRADPSNLVLLCAECHRWVHGKDNIGNEWIRGTPE